MDIDKVSKFIKELRKKENLTQEDLAKVLNVTPQAVSKWERSISMPDITTLKLISKKYNVNINDILDGNYNKEKNKNYIKFLIFILIICIITLIVIVYINKNSNYEVKTLTTTCSSFNISGNAVYSKDKSSIFITNINYCDINDENYKEINCYLYEKKDKTRVTISKCNNDNNKNISLKDYLNNVNFNIDNYKSMCTNFENAKLYLEIEAKDSNNKITKYYVPIKLEDC